MKDNKNLQHLKEVFLQLKKMYVTIHYSDHHSVTNFLDYFDECQKECLEIIHKMELEEDKQNNNNFQQLKKVLLQLKELYANIYYSDPYSVNNFLDHFGECQEKCLEIINKIELEGDK